MTHHTPAPLPTRSVFGWLPLLHGGLLLVLLIGPSRGVPIDTSDAGLFLLVLGSLVAGWGYFRLTARAPFETRIGTACLALASLISLSRLVPPAQYVALALGRPLADPWLAQIDQALGVSVRSSALWLAAHPSLNHGLSVAYFSLLWQFIAIVPLLSLMRQDVELKEFLFHFHVCTAITLIGLALWPAAGAFQYLGFDSTLPQGRFLEHFALVRSGHLPLLKVEQMEGLVSFPSFHIAGAWMVTWALRRTWLVWPALGLNTLLTVATVASGAHYLADALGTGVMVVGSLWLWRWLGRETFLGVRLTPPTTPPLRLPSLPR